MPSQQDDLDAFLADQLQDPAFAAAYEDAHARADLLAGCVRLRKESGVTQAQVARAMGTTQSAVSDLEAGATDPQLTTVQRYARAVGGRLEVSVSAPGQAEAKSEQPKTRRRKRGRSAA
ncbi:MAG: helix-turn-helix domain-containing protein [Actinopolymorphaceae bacterium]